MRKTLIIGGAIAAVLTVAAQPANAYCIDLAPSGYCDLVQVDVVSGVVYGVWESDCDGVPDTTVAGTTDFGTGSFAGDSYKTGLTIFLWDVNVAARTTDFWQTDGTSAVQWYNDMPVGLSVGACPFVASPAIASGTPISRSVPSQ